MGTRQQTNSVNAQLFATGSSQYTQSINNQARLVATAGGYHEPRDHQLPAIKVKSKTQGIKRRTTKQKQQNMRKQQLEAETVGKRKTSSPMTLRGLRDEYRNSLPPQSSHRDSSLKPNSQPT